MIPPPVFACAVTVLLEVPCVVLFYPRQRIRMAGVCAVTTAATNLLMNLVLPPWFESHTTFLLAGELGAFLIEAIAYTFADRSRDLARAMAASALANAVSFGAGLVLPWTI